jgi:hypothetical protein
VTEEVGNRAWRWGVSYDAAIGGRHEMVRVAERAPSESRATRAGGGRAKSMVNEEA